MSVRSVYIVISKIIPICKYPFQYSEEFRPVFSKIFENEKCFSDLRLAVSDYYRFNPVDAENSLIDNEKTSLKENSINQITNAPFIKNTGQVCFDTRSLLFTKFAYEKPQFISSLTGYNEYWLPNAKSLKKDKFSDTVFGYDKTLDDQRMNFLAFELKPPVIITAFFNEKKVARAKIFVHFYASGYIVVNVSVTLKITPDLNYTEIKDILDKEIPGSTKSAWKWQGKKGGTTFKKAIAEILKNIYSSIFNDNQYQKKHIQKWQTALSIVADNSVNEITSGLCINDYNIFTGNSSGSKQHLITSKKGILIINNISKTRQNVLNSFWKVLLLNEFTLLKTQIFTQLIKHFKEETIQLKDFRINSKSGNSKYNFNKKIPLYLLSLDSYILQLASNYRAIYSNLSNASEFSKLHEQIKKVINLWEKELEKAKCLNTLEIKQMIIKLNGNLSLIENINNNQINTTMNNQFNNSTFVNTNFVEGVLNDWEKSKVPYSDNDLEIIKLIDKYAKTDSEKEELLECVTKVITEKETKKKETFFIKLMSFFKENAIAIGSTILKGAVFAFLASKGFAAASIKF